MSHAHAKDKFLTRLRDALADASFVKLTLSGYRGGDRSLKNVFVRPVTLREGPRLQFVYRHASRDVTKNFEQGDALELLDGLVGVEFRHANLFTTRLTSNLEFREGKGARLLEGKPTRTKAPSTAHDQSKHRPVTADRPWLHGLGVTSANGKVAKGMEAKFRQINKFVEVLASLVNEAHLEPSDAKPCSLVDMGCGKGYLTFAAYDWLQRQSTGTWQVRGVDARSELVGLCNRVARDSGFANLKFEQGDIASATLQATDVLIALHACDTATDDAIGRGIKAGAKLILVSPCCHKELRPQLVPPPILAGALRHGIVLERHAEFVTDALRAALLEWAGYDTKVFEFISTEHTAKNLMIAAVKRSAGPRTGANQLVPTRRFGDRRSGDDGAATKVRDLAAFYGVRSQRLAANLEFSLVPAP